MADPAHIFSDEADRAGAHVPLIGIGDYPWLEGGARCTSQAFTVLRYAPPRKVT